ncbi:MAG: SDR family oxidoreductase [Ruminococcus sp.]|nr:SDR family oxidoreductase [Candidatus Apopatosoma intestinale]
MKELENLTAMSHRYGADPAFVLAGGGNTSYKTEDTLYIKGSGTALATITEDGFVRMDRRKLAAMWEKTYPADEKAREAEVLADMMASKLPGEEAKRPSVETLLHDLLSQKYVLHVHPALVNGMTCAKEGETVCHALFPDAIWVESTKPGYILAAACKKQIDAYRAEKGTAPQVLFLQNHGIFFAADTTEEIDGIASEVMETLHSQINTIPHHESCDFDRALAAMLAPELRMLYGAGGAASVKFTVNPDILNFAKSKKAFEPISRSFSPDHIVYCKTEPLYVEGGENAADNLQKAFAKYKDKHGFAPKIVFVENVGMFACGATKKEADTATAVFTDAMDIAVYSESFGGALPLSPELTDFIANWEVESYRAKVSLKSENTKRLSEKVSIVTGSAQGFGRGIAEAMLAEGAYVVIADMNMEGAKTLAAELCKTYGPGRATPVSVNVSDEDSVAAMMDETVLEYGGLDVFVNNAGIVRAGSLDEMTKQNFELVTAVNYTAYFLCAKYASKVMKIQRAYAPSYMADIIEINSKSGLAGSNKNFAYAGSKFGGLGLTQSFALELAPYGIKVNAICPGNYLDGPLWTDPVRGLFVQYLNAGKVPGAKTVDDVRRYYESKVPLNRGCLPKDIARALFYIVEQEYETGQAVPVTGGQEMLN